MKTSFRILSLLIALVLLSASVACGEPDYDARVYFELAEQPSTLDAQTASSDSELLIVRNIYEGLLRYDENGGLTLGACESYQAEGLNYTFNIRKNAKWSDGTPLTAADFLFGIQRALSRETGAPFASRLYAIRNARAVCEKGADVSSLGISAPDEHTLLISLEYADSDFEAALASSVAMPCNKAFFDKCIGKYGLGSQYIISNGSYSITKWNKEDFGIRIYKNEEYNGSFIARNGAVFIACRDDKQPLELLQSNSTDIAFLKNSDVSSARESGITVDSHRNICWVMTLNKALDKRVRAAFAELVSSSVYAESLPEGFSPADSIYPDIVGAATAHGVGVTQYNREDARRLYGEYLNSVKESGIKGVVLSYCENPDIKAAVTAQAGHWQQNLSAFVNIKPYSLESFSQELSSSPAFDAAVFPVTAKSASVQEYLKNFGIDSTSKSPAEIQTELLSDNNLIPFAYENTNIAYTSAIKNIVTQPQNGYIDFSFVLKQE